LLQGWQYVTVRSNFKPKVRYASKTIYQYVTLVRYS